MSEPSRQVAKWYTDAQKLNALKLWLITGNLREVSASMNVKYDTLKTWKASKWWSEMSEEIRTEGHIALSHKMQQVANKALEVTMDRLENGDHVLSPTGGILRKPVAMRDAHQVAISFQDRALKLENGNQTDHNPAVVDRLQSIADAFSKMIKPPKQPDVIDVEYTEHESNADQVPAVDSQGGGSSSQSGEARWQDSNLSVGGVDAVPEEREEGLQEGSPVGEDPETSEIEGSSHADSSPQAS